MQVKHGEASPFALMDFEREEGKCAASRMTPRGHFDNDFRDRKA